MELSWFRKSVLVTLIVALITTLPLPMLNMLFRSTVVVSAATSQPARVTTGPLPSADITITDSAFDPDMITVVIGTEVTWVNGGSVTHQVKSEMPGNTLYLPAILRGMNASSRSNERLPYKTRTATPTHQPEKRSGGSDWDSGVLEPGETFSHPFSTLGSYHYYDPLHPELSGYVVVVPTQPSENGPLIEILAPFDRQSVYTQQPTIEIRYSDFDASVDTASLVVQIVPQNGATTDVTSELTVTNSGAQGTVSTPLADDSSYTLSVSLADSSGNANTASISFYIPPDPASITPPEAPEDAGWVSGVIYDSATCNEYLTTCQGVAGVQVSLSLIDTQALERVRAARAREIEREWLTRGKAPDPMDADVAHSFSQAMNGTVMTGPDGFFAFPVAQTGIYWLRAEKNGYTYGQREAQVVLERSTALNDIYLTPLDSAVTTCDDKGCMHNNSDGSIQLEIPSGAIPAGETREVSATNFEQVEYLPSGDLPPSTWETYAFNLGGDSEITFDKEIMVRQRNERDFAPGTSIPLGYWNQVTQQWEHAGTGIVDATGEWIEMGVTHFSNYDCNDPVTEGNPGPNPQDNSSSGGAGGGDPSDSSNGGDDPDNPDPTPSPTKDPNECENGCVIDLKSGTLEEDITLPPVNVLGQATAPTLLYNTKRANPSEVIDIALSLDPDEGVEFGNHIGFELYIEGQVSDQFFFSAEITSGEVGRYRYLWDARDAQGQLLPPGVYDYAVKFTVPYRAQYCYALNGIFGNPPDCQNGATGVFTDAVEEIWVRGTIKLDSHPDGPFGSGWVLEEQQRLYADESGRLLIADGNRLDEFLDLAQITFTEPRYPQRKAPVLAPLGEPASSKTGTLAHQNESPVVEATKSPIPKLAVATPTPDKSAYQPDISVDQTPPEPEPEEVLPKPAGPDTREPYSAIRQGSYTEVCGAISADETWTVAENPYVMTCDVTVESGVTLTIEPGVVVKTYSSALDLHLYGTLIANGSQEQAIVFTSLRDDTYGGDTNGDGNATTPSPNDWNGITYHGESTGHIINYMIVAYSDYGMYFYLTDQSADLTIQNSTFKSNYAQAAFFNLNNAGGQIIARNNVGMSNTVNGAKIVGSISGSLTLDWQEQIDFPLVLASDVTVNGGATLTMSPGVMFKTYSSALDLHVYGTLIANGTQEKPIVFTSLRDDTYGGDTNNDVDETSPAPNDWNGITYHGESTGHIINHTIVAYSDYGMYFYLTDQSTDLTIQNSTFKSNYAQAVFFNLNNAGGQITARNNVGMGNTVNGAKISGSISGSLSLDWEEQIDFPLVLASDVTVNGGATLTMSPGVMFKTYSSGLDLHVYGTLIADGSQEKPIVFTSLRDDTYGGDTNNDGDKTSPAPNHWNGITYHAGSTGHIINHTIVAYSDYGMYFYLTDQNADLTIENSTFKSNNAQAVYFNLNDARGQITARNNVGMGNTVNGAKIAGSISNSLTLDWQEQINFPLVLASDVVVNGGATLTMSPGVMFKTYSSGLDLHVYGTLIANGSQEKPIVFTSLRDDTYGGDSNNDGNTSAPAPNHWNGIHFRAGSTGHIINYMVVAYSDYGMYFDLTAQNTDLTIENSIFKSNQAQAVYFNLNNAGGQITARNNVGMDNTVNGAKISGSIGASLTLDWQEQINFPLILASDVVVNGGATLTMSPGVMFKTYSSGLDLHVYGTLIANGSQEKPIVFTSLRDDTYGGDSNNDGNTSAPAPNHWNGIHVHPGSTGNIVNYTVVAYSDYGLYVEDGNIEITRSAFYQNQVRGVYIGNGATVAWMLGNNFAGNGNYGLENASSTTIDAPYNWWGAASGPYHPTTNPEGGGDRVSDNVNYEPWLTREQTYDAISMTETDYSGLRYDPDSNSYTRIYLDGTQVHFNPDGTHDYTLSADGRKTIYTYNPDGTVATKAIIAPAEESARWTWSFSYTSGQLDSITDPAGRVTEVTINAHGHLTQVEYPDQSPVHLQSARFTHPTGR